MNPSSPNPGHPPAQFSWGNTVDHIRILRALYEYQNSVNRPNHWLDSIPKIAEIAKERVPGLPTQQAEHEAIVSDLCYRDLLNWHGGKQASFQPKDIPIVLPFAQTFLKFIEAPEVGS